MVRAVWVIAANTIRQTVRQRLFHNLGVFGVGMMLLSMVVGQLTFGFPDRVVRSIGLSGVSIALNLIALLSAVSIIHQEIDRKTLFVVLTRPVRRWQYVLGRYLGLMGTAAMALVGLSVVFFLTLVAVHGTPHAADFFALAATFLEAAVLAGFGVVLSSFSTPTLSAGIGLGLWIASTATDDFVRLTQKADELTKIVAKTAAYVLPNLHGLNFREIAIYQATVPLNEFLYAVVYGGVYSLALVGLASLILGRREMV